MTRLFAAVAALFGAGPALCADAPKPNVVFILADDLGFADLGCYGGEIDTPNLDALAANGVRFTQFYNCARCWPSRGALLTGYYAQHVRRDKLPNVAGGGVGGARPPWAPLLPELLKPAGYRAYHSGKWHIDGKVLAGGFDRSLNVANPGNMFTARGTSRDDVPVKVPADEKGYYVTTAPPTTRSRASRSTRRNTRRLRSSSTSRSTRRTSRCTRCRKTSPSTATSTSTGGTQRARRATRSRRSWAS
jgi:arylsulfatase